MWLKLTSNSDGKTILVNAFVAPSIWVDSEGITSIEAGKDLVYDVKETVDEIWNMLNPTPIPTVKQPVPGGGWNN